MSAPTFRGKPLDLDALDAEARATLPTDDGGSDWHAQDILDLVAEVRRLRRIIEDHRDALRNDAPGESAWWQDVLDGKVTP